MLAVCYTDGMDGHKQKFWQKWTWLHQLLHDNHGVRYFVIAVGLLLATGVGVLAFMWQQPVAEPAAEYTSKIVKPAPKKIYSPLTGNEVADQGLTTRPVTAIMIENSPDARPQSGLKDAGVIFEAVAEGGITRFVALYQESQPGLIGPVRSVRPYYVDWASGFDPAVAHVGGSAKALDMIRSGNYGVDLDQFFNAGTYWRSNDRSAPHNVYTNFERLNALESKKGKTSSTFTFSSRVDEKKADTPTATSINMAVSSGSYVVDYAYDAASNSYIRKQGGQNHVDREAGQIQPKVVIAIKVPMSRGFEDGYREQITTTGSGQGYVFQNGTVTEVTWSKAEAKGQLVFKTADGKEVPLIRGQTWITALAQNKNVSWK